MYTPKGSKEEGNVTMIRGSLANERSARYALRFTTPYWTNAP